MGTKLYSDKCVSSFVIKDDMLHITLTLHIVNVDAFAASANVSLYYYMYTKLLLNLYISVMGSTDTACNLKIFFLTNN